MSSPPAEGKGPEDGPRRARRPYEPWRKLALTGAVILLIGSILKASIEDFPNAVNMLSLGVGWGFLAAGFGRAMVDRRARERDKESRPSS
jgi:hypothetical protein